MSGRFTTPRGKLNGRQRVILAVVGGCTDLESISEASGIPVETVEEHCRKLDAIGWIDLYPSKDGRTVAIEPTIDGRMWSARIKARGHA